MNSYLKKITLLLLLHWSLTCSAHSESLPQHYIDLSFEQINLRDFLKMMAQFNNLNILLSDKVQGNIQMELKNVKWQDVFETALAHKNLSYIHEKGILWVAPLEEINAHRKKLVMEKSYANDLDNGYQVMIEARIVEADQRFARNLGVKLGGKSSTSLLKSEQIKTSNLEFSSPLSSDGLNGFPAASAAITMLSKGSSELLQMELSALEANGQGNIVANPRIFTANLVKATIEQGTELPYQTSSKEGARVQFRRANLKLEVTPKILENHEVLLDVDISKDTIGMKTEQGYAIDTKHLRSQIVIEDGGTAIIGGIFLQTEREDIVQVPFFGSIPILGKLFKHKSKIKDKTELLVFLTPSLLKKGL